MRTPGLVGVNRSPRQGTGTEFASIRPFQPGDRLRRIHWPQSLRTGVLHVTSTWADHDRHVVLLIDALNDVGESGGIDGRASSLDISMRAAGAIAEHYIGTGDRVALVVIGARGVQRLPPASGTPSAPVARGHGHRRAGESSSTMDECPAASGKARWWSCCRRWSRRGRCNVPSRSRARL